MKKVTFSRRVGFHVEVRKRVDQYFDRSGLSRGANLGMVLKTAAALMVVGASYALFLLSASSIPLVIIASFALAQGFVLVGFNIMHDSLHNSYTSSKRLNRLLGLSLELMGGSSMLWQHKHNVLHHTYTNINELDDDLEVPGILRFSPDQQRKPCHRFQHLYAFPVYSLMTFSMVIRSDFQKYFTGKIGDYQMPKPSGADSVLFFAAKALYFGYMLVLPMFFHPVLHVLLFFLLVHAVLGFTMAVVFQLAHIVGDTTFPVPDAGSSEIDNEWAIHQVETTADFAPRSRLATWYLGGLNFQIEHHLFPRVCHVHYPAISRIVEATCQEFDVVYTSYPSIGKAVSAHRTFLKRLGGPEFDHLIPLSADAQA